MKKMMMITTTAYMSERFNRNNILILKELGYEVHVVANFKAGNPTTVDVLKDFKIWVEKHGGKCINIPLCPRPTDIGSLYRSYQKCVSLIREHHYEFIHCHTAVASVVARMAAHKCRTKVIYTAHGLQFMKGGLLKDWILYYPVEKFLSRWTDCIILINDEDYRLVKKRFHAKHVVKIPGVGIDIKKYQNYRPVSDAREELGLGKDDIVLLSVGELNKNKNHEVVLKALSELSQDADKVYYLIAGTGRLEEYLKELSERLGISEHVKFLGYRKDTAALYACADVFVFPSKREGLGLAAVEALASGIPVLALQERGSREYMNEKLGSFCENTSESFAGEIRDWIKRLEHEQNEVSDAAKACSERFDSSLVDNIMRKVYLDMAKSSGK